MAGPSGEAIAVDVHAHLVPVLPEELDAIDGVAAVGGKLEIDGHLVGLDALYRPERLAQWLDANAISRALVSAPPPTYRLHLDGHATRLWADYLNDGLIRICASDPDKLAPMLHLPVHHPDVALAIATEGAKASIDRFSVPAGPVGSIVFSDASLDPLWTALDAQRAFVFIHPGACCDGRLTAFYLENLLGNPYETAVAAAHLVFGGVLERFPGVAFCLAHGGGAVGILAGRWQRGFDTERPDVDRSKAPPAEMVKRFYVDCILHDPAAIRLAAAVFGREKLLFGSDWPFPMGLTSPHAQLALVDAEMRRLIFETNSRRVEALGRLADA